MIGPPTPSQLAIGAPPFPPVHSLFPFFWPFFFMYYPDMATSLELVSLCGNPFFFPFRLSGFLPILASLLSSAAPPHQRCGW